MMVVAVDTVEATVNSLGFASASGVSIDLPFSAKVLVTPLPDARDVIALLLADRLLASIAVVPEATEADRSDAVAPASTVEFTAVSLTCVDPSTAILVPPISLAEVSFAAVDRSKLPTSRVMLLDARFARAVEAMLFPSNPIVKLVTAASGVKLTEIPESVTDEPIVSLAFAVVESWLFSTEIPALPVVVPAVAPFKESAVRSAVKLAATTVFTAVKEVAETDKALDAVLPTAVEVTALDSAIIVTSEVAVRDRAAEARLVPVIAESTPPVRVC